LVYFSALHLFADFTVGVIQVAKIPDIIHAGSNTSRLLTFLDMPGAKPAFLRDTPFVHLPNIIRTGDNTIFAADTFVMINKNHTVFPLISRPGRTYCQAGWIIAVHALNGHYFLPDSRIGSLLPEFQPVKKEFGRQLPLHLASYAASRASRTTGRID
jgi:hypothetical protein